MSETSFTLTESQLLSFQSRMKPLCISKMAKETNSVFSCEINFDEVFALIFTKSYSMEEKMKVCFLQLNKIFNCKRIYHNHFIICVRILSKTNFVGDQKSFKSFFQMF